MTDSSTVPGDETRRAKKVDGGDAAPRLKSDPRTLAIDIGGTGLKASLLDKAGRMTTKRVRIATPHPCPPELLLRELSELVSPLPAFDRISVGFPGFVRLGYVFTAPHFAADDEWRGYALEAALERMLGKPTRLLNDAEVQGLGIISGSGLEVVLTLGTGIGSSVFNNGHLTPHLELGHHPIQDDETYDDYIGDAARAEHGKKKWNRRIRKTIGIVQSLFNYDVLYLGGGNSSKVDIDLPSNVRLADNKAGITGGIRLWDDEIWNAARPKRVGVGS